MGTQAVNNEEFLANPALLTGALSTLSSLYERNPKEVSVLQALLREAITSGPKPRSGEAFAHLGEHLAHAVPSVIANPEGRAALVKLTTDLAAAPPAREIILGAPLPSQVEPPKEFAGVVIGGLIVIGIAAAGTYLYCSLGQDPAPGESAPVNC